jgi:hypothetical protein
VLVEEAPEGFKIAAAGIIFHLLGDTRRAQPYSEEQGRQEAEEATKTRHLLEF